MNLILGTPPRRSRSEKIVRGAKGAGRTLGRAWRAMRAGFREEAQANRVNQVAQERVADRPTGKRR